MTIKTKQETSLKKPLIYSHLSLFVMLGLWFTPGIQQVLQWCDGQIFFFLNSSLAWHDLWMQFWGYLNHPHETWLNLVIMILINFMICFFLKGEERKKALVNLFYYWFMFQLVLPINHVIFSDMMNIHRASPSLTFTPPVWLSEAMGIPGIKDASSSSFPAGHTLVAIYWLRFTLKTAPKIFYPLVISTALLLCFNRVFSGAHWASDIIFTTVLGLAWYYWATLLPMYDWLKKRFLKVT